MEPQEAVARLGADEAWFAFINHMESERESCLSDFQNLEIVEKPQTLAYLAGEIAALDRLLKMVDEGLRVSGVTRTTPLG